MATRSKWQRLATEAVNPRSRNIDTLTPDEIVEVMVLDNETCLRPCNARRGELRAERRTSPMR